ncbi:hypothetical protein JHK87_026867 [Glycine soja]|nr:hypothetical protein JHK87_026867 [Glycine soja]
MAFILQYAGVYQFCIHSLHSRMDNKRSVNVWCIVETVAVLLHDLVISTPWILISQILPIVSTFRKIVNGCLVGWGSSGGELLFIFLTGT